ncbi:response regulator transcription factor [Paenibacillus sp. JDR-2]|uniref:response regulator transcription factor n=1 Tax=Paenibacillus sp. (strain JDR-2) TaxID=324057 RepID=UPI000166656D|nr:response regulator [Paenibacillus sp. JDR-2]ACS99836.1 two component transcriptional regulator, AraC family [Paenibacillus sp. JDR-2]
MYNLLLVDDEPWILKDMEQIIDWNAAGFSIVAKANDVNIAESLLRRMRIDVIISDIRMPGKTGLDLLAFVNRVSPSTLVMFMSAYSDFAYAKQAIEKGCYNYLLKPVNTGELLVALDSCAKRLRERERERGFQKAYDQSVMLLEWIESDLTIRQTLGRIASTGEAFKEAGQYVLMTVKSQEMLTERDLMDIDNLLESYGIGCFKCRNSPLKSTYLLGLPLLPAKTLRNLYREASREVSARGWDAGISRIGSAEHGVHRLYQQSNAMADTPSLNGRNGIYRYKQHVNAAVPALKAQIGKATRLEHLEAALYDIQKGIQRGRIHLIGLAELYNLFVISLSGLIPSGSAVEEDFITSQDLLIYYGKPQDLLEEMMQSIEEHKRRPGEVNALPIVEEVTRDLDRMYAHRISLKEMAQKYYISPNYLSHMFKQEKGQSFIHYLIHKRLEAAVSLLKKDIPLYEVGKLVGYDDYAQFSKLFKKHLGMSPLEYRQRKNA